MGYGGMLMESFVAIMAMVAAISIDQHLYFAMNSPSGVNGGTPEKAAAYLDTLGLVSPGGSPLPPADPAMLAQAATDVGEKSIIGRTGGAPTLAVGMSEIMHGVFGGAGWKSFWYHFAIMFEALFILTTVDAGTRVARFMFSDALGALGLKKFRDPSWTVGAWIATFLVVGGWGSILVMGVNDPLGGINTLYPLFGIANQLLAAIALTVVFAVVMKKGLYRWAWIPGVPLVWDLAVTLTASYQKIFSSVPAIGYGAQRQRFLDAKAQGKVLAPATTPGQMDQVIFNSTVQLALSILYAVLVLVVVAVAVVVSVRAVRAGGLPTSEEPDTPSRIFAPRSFLATPAEKEVLAEWRAAGLEPTPVGGHHR